MTIRERIIAKVVADGSTGCWLWQGDRWGSSGYGRITVAGRSRPVHVLMYELDVGPVPDGLELDHVRERGCVHRYCCNPAHLEPVTHGENQRRSYRPLPTHCKNGHEFTEANTLVTPNGRQCRACNRERQRQWQARRNYGRSPTSVMVNDPNNQGETDEHSPTPTR